MSKIEWTERTWNPMSGCTKVSEGCANCYAEKMANRLKAMGTKGYEDGFAVMLHPDRLDEPVERRKPTMYFVCSMGDLFHEDVDFAYIDAIWAVMVLAKQHTFQVLTKRPERMRKYLDGAKERIGQCFKDAGYSIAFSFPPPNVWLGVTAENQEQADKRIPILLDTPAAVRFVSVEPMLGAINLDMLITNNIEDRFRTVISSLHGKETLWDTKNLIAENEHTNLDWVIVGGETGAGARQLKYEWVKNILEQCQEAEVPLFFKKWGKLKEEGEDGFIDGVKYRQMPRERD